MFYSTISNNDYELYFATEDWLKGAWYDSMNLPAPDTMGDIIPLYKTDPAALVSAYQLDSPQFEAIDPQACIDAYANTYLSNRRHVVLISPWVPSDLHDVNRVDKNSSLHWIKPSNHEILYNAINRYGWLCDKWTTSSQACTNAAAKEYAAQQNWMIFGWPVSGCVSQTLPENCSVNFHLGIAVVVILANLGKTVCIAVVCIFLTDQPLLTTGDAVVSFLRIPDQMTTGCCLLNRRDVRAQWVEAIRARKGFPPKAYIPGKQHRWKAVGRKSWVSFLLLSVP